MKSNEIDILSKFSLPPSLSLSLYIYIYVAYLLLMIFSLLGTPSAHPSPQLCLLQFQPTGSCGLLESEKSGTIVSMGMTGCALLLASSPPRYSLAVSSTRTT
jgi:hypothetical protein